MKMKKVLAALLAGTMILGGTVAVSAENIVGGDAWWPGPDGHSGAEIQTDGDGEWTYDIKVNRGDDGTLLGGAFVVECYDDAGVYLTVTSANDGWVYGVENGEVTGASAGGNGYTVGVADDGSEVDTYKMVVTRTDGNWEFDLFENGDKAISKIKFPNAAIGEKTTLHFYAQIGDYDVTIAGDDSSSSDDSDAEETVAEATTSDDSASADDAAASDDSSDDTSVTSTPQTGDATPIVAVIVALAGCGAVAFASKKRFAK